MRYEKTALRLRNILSERNMTAQELANRSGVGKSSISHYINGNNEPHTLNAGKMAAVLNVNPMYLMGYDVSIEIDAEAKEEKTISMAKRLLAYMERLNPEGIKKLEERAEELTEMSKYTKKEENITRSQENITRSQEKIRESKENL